MQTFKIHSTLAREVTICSRRDAAVPRALFAAKCVKPDLSGVNVPLPARKKDYTCFADTGRALWLGAPNGVTRYEPAAARDADRVMYFCAERDLTDNDVKAIWCDGTDPESVWVLTAKGASHIVLREISAEEKEVLDAKPVPVENQKEDPEKPAPSGPAPGCSRGRSGPRADGL